MDWFRESKAFISLPIAGEIRRIVIAPFRLSFIDASQIWLRLAINIRLIIHPISGRNRREWEKIVGKPGVAEPIAKR